MEVEFSGALGCCGVELAALAQLNLRAFRRQPALAAEVRRRALLPPGAGWRYVRDPRGVDRWTACTILIERYPDPAEPWLTDCEDQVAAHAALAAYDGQPAAVALSEPRGSNLAHAWQPVVGAPGLPPIAIPGDGRAWSVFDPSARNSFDAQGRFLRGGMRPPAPAYYAAGALAIFLYRPELDVWAPVLDLE